VSLIIADDGIGLPAGVDPETTSRFGLILVRMLAEQLEGGFLIENRHGTRIVLEFPI
jgi:two-component sensor histidine kinase